MRVDMMRARIFNVGAALQAGRRLAVAVIHVHDQVIRAHNADTANQLEMYRIRSFGLPISCPPVGKLRSCRQARRDFYRNKLH